LPPAPTGVASYTAGLVPLLPETWDLELFTDTAHADRLGDHQVHATDAWASRHAAAPFDLNVYQIGNGDAHRATLSYVVDHPGLLVLHDAVLHPMRAAAHLAADDIPGYRAALVAGAPATGNAVADVVAAGLGGPALYWNFPMSADLVRASRYTVVHGTMLARWLRAEAATVAVGSVPLWLPVADSSAAQVRAWRDRLGAAGTTPVLGTFGHLGPEHRVGLLVDTLADLAGDFDFRVAVVGAIDPALGLEQSLPPGLAERTVLTGRVDDGDYGALLRAVDLGINLRYPTARAASGPLAQMLSVGTPAVIHDLVHQRDIPEPAVLRVPTGSLAEERAALKGTLSAWLHDDGLRAQAAAAAAAWGAANVTAAGLVGGYVAAVEQARHASAVT
jgi:hypothetical protein